MTTPKSNLRSSKIFKNKVRKADNSPTKHAWPPKFSKDERVRKVKNNLLRFDSKTNPSGSGGGRSKNTININNLNINLDSPNAQRINDLASAEVGKKVGLNKDSSAGNSKGSTPSKKGVDDLTPS